MNSPRALSFLFLYEFSLLVCAESNHTAATTSDEKQVMVGWTAGPTQRGTVMLVYGCLSTIFASTWTVLHLNVPHPNDGVWTRTLRKIKWMAITILFPEFIFSKAVWELRLAVANLYAMHVELEKARVVRSTTIELWDGIIHRNWTWKAEFGPWMRLLYKLLRLPPLKGSKQEQDKIQNSSSAETHESVREADSSDQSHATSARNNQDEYTWSQTCNWTLVHSLYANMGGLRYSADSGFYRKSGVKTNTATARDIIEKCHGGASCPLKDFILEKEDIEDKSKADWLLRAIAVSQILWLILNVATRHIAKLPVTQLEIATVAFSLMAAATYAANWWKPKDIVTPMVLNHSFSINADEDRRNFRPFTKRLLTPSRTDDFYVVPGRIKNDIIWIESETPLISGLMAMSSLVFGGLHCFAWNFDFPTGAELVLWRVASLASGALPTFALGVSLLSFRTVKFSDKKCTLSILEAWASLEQFPPA